MVDLLGEEERPLRTFPWGDARYELLTEFGAESQEVDDRHLITEIARDYSVYEARHSREDFDAVLNGELPQ
ncbi:MAG: hypothetical protein ABSG43_22875 [Solirubrobacteraceae bacterium]